MDLEVLSPWMWVATTMVVLAVTSLVFGRFTKQTQMAKLPYKGSWSLPFVGETWQLSRQDFHQFFIDHLTRSDVLPLVLSNSTKRKFVIRYGYGDPFRTSLLGRTIIVMNTSESIKYVLSTSQKSFASGYPINFLVLIGSRKIMDPQFHSHVKKLAVKTFNISNLRSILSFINSKARETVDSWESMRTVNTCEEMTKFTFSVMMHLVWADMASSSEVENIREEMGRLGEGLDVMRINLPQFSWYRALKAREAVVARIKESLANRRKDGSQYKDFLGGLMEIECDILKDDLCNIMVGVMFAGYSSTAVLIPWTIKYLHDYPTVRESIQTEQDGIREKMIKGDFLESFTLKECMPLTSQVVDEVLRIQSIAPLVSRQALKAVEYKGDVIPKDSTVWASICSLHMNPDLFPNPTMFHPSRFETPPKPNTFLPFGSGPHMCPGGDIAKIETIFVVHHLLTKYSWERVGLDGGVRKRVFSKPKDGFPIIVQRRTPQK